MDKALLVGIILPNNKIDIESDLIEKNSKCNILSALFLNNNEHQEIKTRMNHLAPNCQSYQKVKKVLHLVNKKYLIKTIN